MRTTLILVALIMAPSGVSISEAVMNIILVALILLACADLYELVWKD